MTARYDPSVGTELLRRAQDGDDDALTAYLAHVSALGDLLDELLATGRTAELGPVSDCGGAS